MKKIISLLVSFSLAFSLIGCKSEEAAETKGREADRFSHYSDADIERYTAEALYKEINSRVYGADAGNCRYNISSTKIENDISLCVYGTVYFYDSRGNSVKYTGSTSADFKVSLSEIKGVYVCTLKAN